MSYELRKFENANIKCPLCFGRTVKAGETHTGVQKHICVDCMFQFVEHKKGESIEEMEAKIQKNRDAINKLKELANVASPNS